MRIALVILAVLAAGLGIGYAAFGRGDKLDDLKIPEVARESGTAHHFDVEPFAKGFNRPTWVGQAPGDDAIWVTEQPGRVIRIDGGRRPVALDLGARVRLGAEQGLLGIAFHPDFAGDRRVYLHWSNPKGDTRVAEFKARKDGTIDPEPLRELLHVDQP